MLRPRFAAAVLAIATLVPAATAAGPTLEEGLLTQAASVIRRCKDNGYKNVAVLKFHVKKGDERLSHNVGTLNQSLARRLEIALVLQNDPRQPVGVVRDASAVAARTAGADHLTANGRTRLFSARYPLMWGANTVTPDVFVTGVAEVDDSLKTVRVNLVAFDRTSKKPEPVGEAFSAAVQAGQLGEMGESFALRGAFESDDPPATLTTLPQDAAAKVKRDEQTHPLRPKAAPVSLAFRYDGKPVEVEFRNGKGFVPTPALGQKVELVLTRDRAPETYGVVLKVNGENTIGRQTRPDAECGKWVMSTGSKPYVIRGYQSGEKTAEEFRVVSGREAAKLAVNYGEDVGTVTMTVFRELKGKPSAPRTDEYGSKVESVRSQTAPKDKDTFEQLYGELTGEFGSKGLPGDGLVTTGGTISNDVRKRSFVPDPNPLASVTVVYYTP